MIALTVDWAEPESSSLLRWIVPGSIALHVVLFAWLPSADRTPALSLPPPPLVLEMKEPPPPPAPEPEPEATPAPTTVATPTPVRAMNATRAAHAVEPAATTAAAPSDAPIDFTSTVFSNDGPGLAVGGGGGGSGAVAAAPVVAPRAQAPLPPRIVPPSSLARKPRAPGLDAELERHYPTDARRAGISGTAVLRVRVLPDGRIGEVHVVSESWTGFGPACERTVRGARWEPPIDRDGTPVTTEITYTCRFEVRS